MMGMRRSWLGPLAAALIGIVCLGLVLAGPVRAATVRGGTVTITYKLRLLGTVPRGQAFSLEYEYSGHSGSKWFCGNAGAPTCTGNGTAYTVQIVVPEGAKVGAVWDRWIPGDAEGHPFFHRTDTAGASTSASAYFRFGAPQATPTPQSSGMPLKLPDTGAGGMSR